MHISAPHLLVGAAVIGSAMLVLDRNDRLFPIVALLASGLEALMEFGVITLTLAHYRIDVILAAVLAFAGGACWAKSSTKPAITAAAVVVCAGALQLLSAIGVLD